MEMPILTYETFITKFPSVKPKSKMLARNLLPIYPSAGLAKIVGALLADGHIDWYTSDGRPRTRKAILYSSNRWECEWFLTLIKEVFGVTGKVYAYVPKSGYWKVQPYKAVISNSTVARILILLGVVAGDKTKQDYMVPLWIKNGGRKIKQEFLRTFFNFEGSVPQKSPGRYCSWRIGLTAVKKKENAESGKLFLGGIKELLMVFGVKATGPNCYRLTTCLSKGGIMLTLHICSQQSVVNFYRWLCFVNPQKRERLEAAVLDIKNKGRINSRPVSDFIKKAKLKFGTDCKVIEEVNKHSLSHYTTRQAEHFRRMESKVPYDFLFNLMKSSGDLSLIGELPPFVRFLWKNDF